jgi:hypothetical protein
MGSMFKLLTIHCLIPFSFSFVFPGHFYRIVYIQYMILSDDKTPVKFPTVDNISIF